MHSAITGYLESKGVKPASEKGEVYDELLEMAREVRREERRAARSG